MRRALAVFCWLVFAPFTASALGLGDITLDSALNQPFSAQIPVESFEEEDLKSLRVGLASGETFERYGLDLPVWMSNFEFAVADDGNGNPVVRVTSQRPVAEPFVTLLLDIKWSSGRLLREYTVLLDPPLFEEAPAQVAVAPAEAQPEQQAVVSQSAGEVTRSAAAPTPAVATSPEPAPAPAPQPAPVSAAPVTSAPAALTGTSYTVQRRETLWGIAERVRGDSDMTVNQVMLALYRANPDAFLGNINRLKAGAILRVPESADLDAVTPAEATAAVREQNAALDSAAQSTPVAAAPAQLTLVAPEDDLASTGSGDGQSTVTTSTEAGLDAARDSAEAARLRSQVDQLEGELTESRRLLEARDAEMAAMQRRLAVLEAGRDGADEMGADVEAVDEVLVEDDLPVADSLADPDADAVVSEADTPFAADADIAAEETATADTAGEDAAAVQPETEAEESTVADPVTTVAPRAEEPSFIESLIGNIWFWVSAAVVLVLALFVARRGKRDSIEDEGLDADASGSWREAALDADAAEADHAETMRDLESLPAHDESIVVEEAPVAEAPDSDPDATSQLDDLLDDADADDADKTTELQLPDEGDSETPLEKTISTGGLVDLDQADPIAEAEFHMAYGLYDQAAELLERSLEDDPDNREYRTKLIEVFFVWENRDGFLTHARALRERVSDDADSDWNKVVILGKQLCPEDELFSGSDAAAPVADSMDFELTDLGDDAGDTELDFTLGGADNEVEALDEDLFSGDGAEDAEASSDSEELDFDLGDGFGDAEDDLALNLGEDDLGDDTDDSATTMESPTMEAGMDDVGGDTLETPTIESPAVAHDDDDAVEVDIDFGDDELIDDSAATMETPTIESDMSEMNEPTLESPTLESAADGGETSEMPALDPADFDSNEIDLDLGGADDLDVDLSGLDDELGDNDDTTEMPVDTGELADDEIGDDDATLLASADDVADLAADEETMVSDVADLENDLEAEIEAELEAQTEAASDTVEQPQIDQADVELGETAEQPAIPDAGDVDFDLGMEAEADDDVATAIQEASLPEDATMTEVGTKLDLARAYIDMGDPDGARSILNEVLDEGGDEQQQEARQLLEELGD